MGLLTHERLEGFRWSNSDEIDTKVGERDVEILAVTISTFSEDLGASGLFDGRLEVIFLLNATLSLLDTILSSVTVSSILDIYLLFYGINAKDSALDHLRTQFNV